MIYQNNNLKVALESMSNLTDLLEVARDDMIEALSTPQPAAVTVKELAKAIREAVCLDRDTIGDWNIIRWACVAADVLSRLNITPAEATPAAAKEQGKTMGEVLAFVYGLNQYELASLLRDKHHTTNAGWIQISEAIISHLRALATRTTAANNTTGQI